MDWTEIGNTAVSILLPIVLTGLGTLATIAFKRFSSWMATREMGEKTKTAILQISEAAAAAVADLEVTMRPYMSDGLTKAEQEEIKAAALNRIKTQAPVALKSLTAAGMADLDVFVNGKIERAVAEMPKQLEAVVGTSPSDDLKAIGNEIADGELSFFETHG